MRTFGALALFLVACSNPEPPKTAAPTPKSSATAAATTSCKPDEVDNGDGCFKACSDDKDCVTPMKCLSMWVANPNGGTSTAMTCQKPD